jgi:hypothetical protein
MRVAKTRSMPQHTLIHAERGEGGAVKGVGESRALRALRELREGGEGLGPDAMRALAARPLERVQRRRSLRPLEPLQPHLLLTRQSESLLQSHHPHRSLPPLKPSQPHICERHGCEGEGGSGLASGLGPRASNLGRLHACRPSPCLRGHGDMSSPCLLGRRLLASHACLRAMSPRADMHVS